jgi:hypothetical protein
MRGTPSATARCLWPGPEDAKQWIMSIDLEVVKSNLVNYVNGDISGCANPLNLNKTAHINTAASCTLLTKTAPPAVSTNADIQIIVIQPCGNQMTTMHAVNLLLWNLPPEARLGHHLTSLVNNLLYITALVDAGCKVFFHCTGC